ncbi:hypothetical protein PPL_12611 [Heterostelium album PN500]|uniref:SIR2-like domain-containing protein n=1 Tax=Heterostelium pallidum (strain ATCC 26659 / Pp 5 / PN500) TaxID=670386 RepID=D3BN34_HETP5|nr:hypothetical protein PPL_12611 [Heterostelium album PN500]EFA77396.1 hypothetical protein PPL_12611 [Heterostelium album PN500]|eukprot:XP_020429525.1 hypothetical protein PPL_12611 [Heterostelium album PN500]
MIETKSSDKEVNESSTSTPTTDHSNINSDNQNENDSHSDDKNNNIVNSNSNSRNSIDVQQKDNTKELDSIDSKNDGSDTLECNIINDSVQQQLHQQTTESEINKSSEIKKMSIVELMEKQGDPSINLTRSASSLSLDRPISTSSPSEMDTSKKTRPHSINLSKSQSLVQLPTLHSPTLSGKYLPLTPHLSILEQIKVLSELEKQKELPISNEQYENLFIENPLPLSVSNKSISLSSSSSIEDINNTSSDELSVSTEITKNNDNHGNHSNNNNNIISTNDDLIITEITDELRRLIDLTASKNQESVKTTTTTTPTATPTPNQTLEPQATDSTPSILEPETTDSTTSTASASTTTTSITLSKESASQDNPSPPPPPPQKSVDITSPEKKKISIMKKLESTISQILNKKKIAEAKTDSPNGETAESTIYGPKTCIGYRGETFEVDFSMLSKLPTPSKDDGHVFLVYGDLCKLVCDVKMVPSPGHSLLRVGLGAWLKKDWDQFSPDIRNRVLHANPPTAQHLRIEKDARVFKIKDWPIEYPNISQPWFTTVVPPHGSSPSARLSWYIGAARDFLNDVGKDLEKNKPPIKNGRSKYLVALPIVGTGGGGGGEYAGVILSMLLHELYVATRVWKYDVVLVTNELPMYTAARNTRKQMMEKDKSFKYIYNTLLGNAMLEKAKRNIEPDETSTPVTDVITTNYDQCFEIASRAINVPCTVLPYETITDKKNRWILKLHGCVSHPSDIVITREDYIRYGDKREALSGILQSSLITKHILFVGFSLVDDNFFQVMSAVKAATQKTQKKYGTALFIQKNDLMNELWGQQIDFLCFDPENKGKIAECARIQEIFLEYLTSMSISNTSHVMEKRFDYLLQEGEKIFRDNLNIFVKDMPDEAKKTEVYKKFEQFLTDIGYYNM